MQLSACCLWGDLKRIVGRNDMAKATETDQQANTFACNNVYVLVPSKTVVNCQA